MDNEKRLKWLYENGMHPFDNNKMFPVFGSLEEVEWVCTLLNHELTRKFGGASSSIENDYSITLDFE